MVLTVYVTFGCYQLPDNTNKITSLQEVLTEIQSAADTFLIDQKKDTLLVANNGSNIKIPANAFQLVDGSTPIGNVKVSVIEAFSVNHILGHNLHTTSNGQLLETGGMINIEASSNGVQLILKENQTIEVSIPKNNDQPDMELFYEVEQEDGTVTWVTADEIEIANEADTTKYEYYGGDSIATTGDFTTERMSSYPEELYDYHFKYISWVDEGLSDIQLKGKNQNLIQFIEDPANANREDVKEFIDNYWRVFFEIRIDENGKLHDYKLRNDPYLNSSKMKDAANAVTIAVKLLESAPPFDLRSVKGSVDHGKRYLIGVSGNKRLNKAKYRKWFREQGVKEETVTEEGSGNSIGRYVFNVSRLGWINCDRFYEMADSLKVNMQIEIPELQDASISLVFKDLKSVMSSTPANGVYSFDNIPSGSAVYVVAISYDDKTAKIAIMDTKVRGGKIKITDFKSVTLDELDQELDQIGW